MNTTTLRLYIDHNKIPAIKEVIDRVKTMRRGDRAGAKEQLMAAIAEHAVLGRFEDGEVMTKWPARHPIFIQIEEPDIDLGQQTIVQEPRLVGSEELIGLITLVHYFHMPPDRTIAIQRFERSEQSVYGLVDYEPTRDSPRRCKITIEGRDLGAIAKLGVDILTDKIAAV